MKLATVTMASIAFLVPSSLLAQVKPGSAQASALQPITRAQLLAGIDQDFKTLDTDHSGALTNAELAAAQARGVANAQAEFVKRRQAIFQTMDKDHDGQVSLAEFEAAVPPPKLNQLPVDQAMAAIDANHDGKVTLDEFRARQLAKFDRLDTNHDGVLSVEELRAARANAQH